MVRAPPIAVPRAGLRRPSVVAAGRGAGRAAAAAMGEEREVEARERRKRSVDCILKETCAFERDSKVDVVLVEGD